MGSAKSSKRSAPIDLSILRTPELNNGIRVNAKMCQIMFICSDQSVSVKIVTNEDFLGKNQDELFNRDSLETDLKNKFDGCTIYNAAAAAGKIGYIDEYYDSYFKIGSVINATTSDIVRPDTFTITNPVTIAGRTLLLAANSNRKSFSIQNESGASGWVGGVAVTQSGATKGITVADTGFYEKDNKAAIYWYSVLGAAAGLITVLEEA